MAAAPRARGSLPALLLAAAACALLADLRARPSEAQAWASPRPAAVGLRAGRAAGRTAGRAAGVVVDAEEVSFAPAAANASDAGNASVTRGPGKVAVITGASTGIGLATAEGMARSGIYGTFVLAGRNAEKHEKAIATLRERLGKQGEEIMFVHSPLDLNSLQSVRDFAASFAKMEVPLHTLVLNAGIMALPEREVTEDGFERQMGVNHLAHFLLANLLLDRVVASGTASDPARVVVLSSTAHTMPSPLLAGDLTDLQSVRYQAWSAYGQSKLSNIMFAYELDRRCRDLGLPVAVNAVHPGVVNTELPRYLAGDVKLPGPLQDLSKRVGSVLLKTPEDGAKTSVLLATKPEGKISGRYWQDERPAASIDVDPAGELPAGLKALLPARPRLTSYDPEVWAALWRESEQLVGIGPEDVAAFRAA